MSIERRIENNTILQERSLQDQRRSEIKSGLVTGGIALGILTIVGAAIATEGLAFGAIIAVPATAFAIFSGHSFSEARRLRKEAQSEKVKK
jgi:hypothetical protein